MEKLETILKKITHGWLMLLLGFCIVASVPGYIEIAEIYNSLQTKSSLKDIIFFGYICPTLVVFVVILLIAKTIGRKLNFKDILLAPFVMPIAWGVTTAASVYKGINTIVICFAIFAAFIIGMRATILVLKIKEELHTLK